MSRRLAPFALGILLAVLAGLNPGPVARAQGPACQPVQVASITTNVDFVPRPPAPVAGPVRVAGLQPWSAGWPLADSILDRVADVLSVGPVCLATDGPDRTSDGLLQRQVLLPNGQGPLALLLVRRGWAQVAPDAETSAPTLAASLRAAEAEARAANRGIWQVLNALTPYSAPSGGTVTVDGRLIPALNALAQLDVGRPLLDGLAQGNVLLFIMAEPQGIWGHYDGTSHVIGVDRSLAGADPRTLATLLAHEAAHALDDTAGMVAQMTQRAGDSGACYADEYQATVTEMQVWQQFFGSQGKPPPLSAFERQENADLARYLRAPQGFTARLMAQYTSECGR
jgi:hypothetical protein